MANLVFLSKENIPLTTSEIIAKALDKRHHDVIELIRNHEKVINNFGKVFYKSENSEAFKTLRGAIKEKKVAYLTEEQATIVICLMRNSPKVLAFKVALVKAFYQMKEVLSQKLGYYTPEQISHIKSTYRKQGYALAMKNIEKNQQDKLELSGENKKKLIQVLEFLYQQREKSLDFIGEITDLQRKLEQVKEHLNLSGSNLIGTHSTLLCALKKLNDK